MNWNPPESEADWIECLSAYMDGELELESVRPLEAYLAAHPDRARQLDALREAGDALREWDVPAPAIDPELRATLHSKSNPKRITVFQHRPQLWVTALRTAAAFALGISVGVMGLRPDVPVASNQMANLDAPSSPSTTAQFIGLNGEQADTLFREAQADSLRLRIVSAVQRGEWKQVTADYETLQNEFSDTQAARAAAESRANWMQRASVPRIGRI